MHELTLYRVLFFKAYDKLCPSKGRIFYKAERKMSSFNATGSAASKTNKSYSSKFVHNMVYGRAATNNTVNTV